MTTKVGVGVFVTKNDKFLIGKRLGSHGAGSYALPGGHLEFQETFEECATREVKEETNLDIQNIKQCGVTNDIFKIEKKHYITIFVICELKDETQTPVVLEKEKCESWNWVSWDELIKLKPMFIPLENFTKQNKKPSI
eukprot:gene3815-6976_t